MVVYDYIFVFIVLIFSIGGLYFGVVKSFSKLFCLLIPLLISYIGATEFNSKLVSEFSFYSGTGSFLASSILLYLGIYLLSKLFFFLIEAILSSLRLSLLNRLFGLVTGLFLGFTLGYLFLLITTNAFNLETFLFNKIKGYLSFFLTI